MLKLYFREILDQFSKENFRRLEENDENDQIKKAQWEFKEITFTTAVTNFKYAHHLDFVPRDIIQTSITGVGSLTFNYANFDETNLDITTTNACVVRFFVGRFQ